MSPVAVVLIVSAAVAHATWNLAAKRAGAAGAAFVWLYAAMSLVVLVPVALAELVLGGARPSWVWLAALTVSGLLHTTYFVLLQRGYTHGDLSVVYPLARGTGPLLSVVLAMVLLGERPGPLALAGAAAVVGGVLLIGSAHGDRPENSPGASRRVGLAYGIVTGITIAAYTLWDANAVTTLGVPPLVETAGSATVQTLALVPFVLATAGEPGRVWRTHRTAAAVIAVLSPLAYVLVLYALRLAPVALVAPARELSIVIGSVIAWRVLREPRPLVRLGGAAIVLAGVFALALS